MVNNGGTRGTGLWPIAILRFTFFSPCARYHIFDEGCLCGFALLVCFVFFRLDCCVFIIFCLVPCRQLPMLWQEQELQPLFIPYAIYIYLRCFCRCSLTVAAVMASAATDFKKNICGNFTGIGCWAKINLGVKTSSGFVLLLVFKDSRILYRMISCFFP